MGRKEYKKVYHGVPKSNTDEHTIFYLNNHITKNIIANSTQTYNSPTYIGYTDFKGTDGLVTTISSIAQLTIDFWIDVTNYKTGTDSTILSILNGKNDRIIIIDQPTTASGKLYFSGTTGANHYGDYSVNTNILKGLNHIRCTLNGSKMCVYVNGNIVHSKDTFIHWSNGLKKVMLFMSSNNKNTLTSVYNLKGSTISDLHISNIDRGDYFPNLPQDFIEGKAIIKPRMGQQQIKGDPMYSQVTTVKIPAFNAETSKLYCLNDERSKGYLKDNPEVFDVINADKWDSSSTFKLKGLNDEIISGQLDSDTALCHILSYVSGAKAGQNHVVLKLSDISNLELHDTVRIYFSKHHGTGKLSTLIYTVSELNPELNEVKLIGDGNYSSDVSVNMFRGGLLVETTASTSVPIVKTEEGTVVKGTWSGLGTSEATFRLGINSDLKGKDLYIDYSLIMPFGNSDFTDIPQDIEYINNQNSVKLIQTDKLTIEDDYMGKINNKYGNNHPFSAYYTSGSNLIDITSLISTMELSTPYYYNISINNPLDNITYTTSSTNTILQVVCKFNIIEMIEQKFGREIPAIDKVNWIKENLKTLSYHVIAGGGRVRIVPYFYKEKRWYKDPTVYNGINYSVISYVNSNTAPHYWASNSIDSNGNTYLMIFTDTITAPETKIDLNVAYIKLSIELMYDSTFNLYFSENRRAREDKCVPMLVQKETKTIKSYLDIKEPIVTEYVYNKFKGVSPSVVPSFEEFEYSNNIQINSMGTGRAVTANNVNYKASIAYLTKRDTCNYTAEPVCNTAYEMYSDYATEHYASGTKYISRTNTYANRSYGILVDGRDVDANNFTTIFPFLINHNGSLHLGTITDFFINRKQSGQEIYYFPLPNTPLLK